MLKNSKSVWEFNASDWKKPNTEWLHAQEKWAGS
jgi:hypothetical protein